MPAIAAKIVAFLPDFDTQFSGLVIRTNCTWNHPCIDPVIGIVKKPSHGRHDIQGLARSDPE
jgi:hypothetical protein